MLSIEIVIDKIFRLIAIRCRAFRDVGLHIMCLNRCLIIVAIVDLNSSVTIK